jgi:hypothetical protein
MADLSNATGLPRPPASVRPLLAALANPSACERLDEAHWDRLIPLARSARLLGVLAHRVTTTFDAVRLPERVQRHLHAGLIEARFKRQKTLHLLHTITPLLSGHAQPWVLLKGAAYIAQDLPLAHGRLPADVDLMVRRSALDGVEASLVNAGWEFEKTDPYDQHFYRAWSHELPPMQAAGQALQLDLHHAILPPIGRIRVDTGALFDEAIPIAGTPFHALSAIDQALHAVVHLVHDSDMVGRLRDLVDIDALFRLLPLSDDTRALALIDRARRHGMERPLWMAAQLCSDWFDTPGADSVLRQLRKAGLPRLGGKTAVRLGSRVLGPPDPERGLNRTHRLAGLALESRALWLRMPPWLLAYHGLSKAGRALTRRRTAPDQAAPG